MDRPTPPYGPTPPKAPSEDANSSVPTGPAGQVPKPSRGGGVRPGASAIGGAIKGKLSGQGAGAGALKGAQDSDNEAVADAAGIAQAAVMGAAKGGVGGAISSAAIAGLKSKTGRKAMLSVLVGIPVLIAVVLGSVLSPDDTQNFGTLTVAHSVNANAAISTVITDPEVVSTLTTAANNNSVPVAALSAIYQTQSVNKTPTGPMGIDLAAAGTGKDGISKANAMKLPAAADFVAHRLSESLRTAMSGTDATSLDAGMVDGKDSNGNSKLVPDDSPTAAAARAESKTRWVAAFKALPLTGISDNSDAVYGLSSMFSAGGQCQPGPDTTTIGAPKVGQTPATLNATQKGYAKAIVKKAVDMGLGQQAAVIAIMTTLTESSLQMYWNPKVPGSQMLAQGGPKGTDGYSVGLFQQQVNGSAYSWGTVEQAMDPAYSAGSFLTRLQGLKGGWQDLDLGVAAQKVQVSAFPARYAIHQTAAEGIVADALKTLGTSASSGSAVSPAPGSTGPTQSADCLGANTGSATAGAGIPGGGTGVDPTGTYIRPIVGGTVTQFGWRFHPIHLRWMIHYGNDFPMKSGTPIYATAAGTVSYSGPKGDFGNHIRIEHAGGVASSYSHIVDGGLLVHVGDHVVQGQMIAKVGSTGGSTGPHLHFEMYFGGKTIDALAYMTNRTIRHDSDCGPPPAASAPH